MTGTSNYTVTVWWDEEWGVWMWHDPEHGEGGVCSQERRPNDG